MGLQAEGKRLDPLREQPGRVRGEGGSDVAQLFCAQAGEEGVLAEIAVPVEPAIGGNRLVEEREVLIGPVETAGLDDDTAEGRAVSAKELGGRMDHDVGSPLDRTVEVRCRDRGVDDERDVVGMRDVGEPFEIRDLAGRVGDDLGEEQLRLVGDRGRVVRRIGTLHERRLDPEATQGHVELGDRAAVEVRGCHDVVARPRKRCEGDELRAQAACRRDRAESAFQRCDALFEGGDGRVAEAAVDVAVFLQGETGRGIRGVIEHEGGRLVDGEGARACHRIRDIARVNRARAETVLSISHAFTLPEAGNDECRCRHDA